MAGVDPYAPCPCGSGQKFKWCCQKVEPLAEKARRLYEGGQIDAALAALDEGLRKAPGNAWLANQKAAMLIRQDRAGDASRLLEDVVAKNPTSARSWALHIRGLLESSGPLRAAEALQRAMDAIPAENRSMLSSTAQLIGIVFHEIGFFPSAAQHLRLALALGGGSQYEGNQSVLSALRVIEGSPTVSPWVRNVYRLDPSAVELDHDQSERFQAAIAPAKEGRWVAAATALETLAREGVAVAERGLGLCRLWLGDNEAAAQAFRRYVRAAGETEDAVDIECLRQLIAPTSDDDQVDLIQLIWTLRDRAHLLAALEASDRVAAEGPVPLEPEDPESVEVEGFSILDRAKPDGVPPIAFENFPQIVGRVLVGQEIALLEALDDGRLDRLANWLTDLAGPALPPAQPRTKEVEKQLRHVVAMLQPIWTPEDLTPDQVNELQGQRRRRFVDEIWPNTPMPYLDGRTPVEAARNADAATRVALRAAVFQFDVVMYPARGDLDFNRLRDRLGIGPEPELLPDTTAEVAELHIARLQLVRVDQLSDEPLLVLYRRARATGMLQALGRAAEEITRRSDLLSRNDVDRVEIHLDLAGLAMDRGDKSEAVSWLRRGRESDPEARSRALVWDLADVRLRSQIDPPEDWVPELAIVLEQARNDPEASQSIVTTLLDLGLVRLLPNPDRPGEYLLDSRALQAVMAEYGPRITTAQGNLGISASRGGIWTPGSDVGATGSAAGGGIWTPGSGPETPPDRGKPGLIIPGR